jgi:hypothetical protein
MISASEAKVKSNTNAINIDQENFALEKLAIDRWVQQQIPFIEKAIDNAIENGKQVCRLDCDTMSSLSNHLQMETLIALIQSYHYTVEYHADFASSLIISW